MTNREQEQTLTAANPVTDEDQTSAEDALIPPEIDLEGMLSLQRMREKLFGPAAAPIHIGRYVAEELLGSGGMATVYRGFDPDLQRRVAIKIPRMDASSLVAEQFLREAILLARLSHPNVVSILDAGHWRDRMYIILDYVDGTTLRQWTHARPDPRLLLTCIINAAKGLEAIHRAGIVHGDIKPDNILINSEGRPLITDFGLSRFDNLKLERLSGSTSTPRPFETRTDTHLSLTGTPDYIAPEQWSGREADALSDQFSFCVMAYELLFEKPPFAHELEMAKNGALNNEARSAHLMQLMRTPASIHPPYRRGIPRRTARAIARGLQANPSLRFPSMAAFVAAASPPSWRLMLIFISGIVIGILSTIVIVYATT